MSGLPAYGRELQDIAIDTSYNKDAICATGRLLTPEKPLRGQIDAHVTEIRHSPRPRGNSANFWRLPTIMLMCLLCGCAAAVGHHFYFQSLDSTTVKSTTTQQWAIRIGTAFAIFTQTCFKATTGIACIQYGWKVMRGKVLTVKAIDKLFDLTFDPFSLFSIELLSKSVALVVLAAFVWYVGSQFIDWTTILLEYADNRCLGSCPLLQ